LLATRGWARHELRETADTLASLCFIKFSSYPSFNVRVWINGHEWAKRQLDHRGIPYAQLDNGFLSCADPPQLQHTCDALSSDHIDAFFRKWLRLLPHPFTADDRYRLSQ